jgi:hypothetical protein
MKSNPGEEEGGSKAGGDCDIAMPATAYMMFCETKRPEIKAKHPTAHVPQLGRLLGEQWRKLSNAEREKWKAKAAAARGATSAGKAKAKKVEGKKAVDKKVKKTKGNAAR